MAHTYASNFVHCVFSTKGRARLIPRDRQQNLWAYLSGIAQRHQFETVAIGGIANHVHILVVLPPSKSLADAIRELKANSSRWMNETTRGFAWQEGYGAFSVSPSQVPVVKEYIRQQAEHHRKRSFEDEFLALLKKCGIEYDANFVLG